MKIITFTWIAVSLAAAQSQPQQAGAPSHPGQKKAAAVAPAQSGRHKRVHAQPSQPAPAQNAATPAPVIPAGATQVEPNLYRYTDTQGKTWMFRQTPFGISKWEDSPSSQLAVPAPQAAPPVKVTDLGDRVQFERDMPFGATKWIRKKSELTEDEQALLHTAQPQAANQTVGKQ